MLPHDTDTFIRKPGEHDVAFVANTVHLVVPLFHDRFLRDTFRAKREATILAAHLKYVLNVFHYQAAYIQPVLAVFA